MDFLRRIKDAEFPLEVHDEADIRNAIVLKAAELIEAQLPAVDSPVTDPRAIIFRITPQGRAAIPKSKVLQSSRNSSNGALQKTTPYSHGKGRALVAIMALHTSLRER